MRKFRNFISIKSSVIVLVENNVTAMRKVIQPWLRRKALNVTCSNSYIVFSLLEMAMHLKSIQWNTLCPMKSHKDETISVMENLRRLNRVFAQCLRAHQGNVSLVTFQVLFFISRSLKAIKRFGLSFAVVNIIKMIFVTRLRLHEGRCLPVLIWLCF